MNDQVSFGDTHGVQALRTGLSLVPTPQSAETPDTTAAYVTQLRAAQLLPLLELTLTLCARELFDAPKYQGSDARENGLPAVVTEWAKVAQEILQNGETLPLWGDRQRGRQWAQRAIHAQDQQVEQRAQTMAEAMVVNATAAQFGVGSGKLLPEADIKWAEDLTRRVLAIYSTGLLHGIDQ